MKTTMKEQKEEGQVDLTKKRETPESNIRPVDARRRFNIYKTSIRRRLCRIDVVKTSYRRRIDVETTSCVYWEKSFFQQKTSLHFFC